MVTLPEEPPPAIGHALRERGVSIPPVLAVRIDMHRDGTYGEGWLLVAGGKLIALEVDAEVVRVLATVDCARLEHPAIDNLVSGGILRVTERRNGTGRRRPLEHAFARFSAARARDVGTFAKLLGEVLEGRQISAGDLPPVQDATCPRCGRRFPDPHRPVCPRCLDKRGLLARVLGYARPYRAQVGVVALVIVISALARLLIPIASGRIFFDDVLSPDGRYHGMIGPLILVILGLHAVSALGSIASGRLNARVVADLVFDMKTGLFDAMQRLSLGFFNRKQTGALMARVNHDTLVVQFFFSDGLPYLVVHGLTIAGIGAAMFAVNWRLALLVFVPVPAIVAFIHTLFPRLWRAFKRQFRSRASLAARVNDALTGVRVIKAFGKEEDEIDRFEPINDTVYRSTLVTGRMAATIFPAAHLLMQLGGTLVWAVGGWAVIGGSLTFGTLMTFIGYLAMVYNPLMFMTQIVDWWSQAMASAQRVFEITDAHPDVRDAADPRPLPHMRGDVELDSVTFSYEPNKPVLHAVSISVGAGEVVGLVGPTGAGKSTITNLITRLYDPDEGSVRIDGVDVREYRQSDLRRQIGIIQQEPYLFTGSIAENIAYARPEASQPEVVAAARAAHAHDFITSLADGYDTMLGKRGHDLSVGERQRVAIARAILLDPRLLILDEATSSVDTDTERKIQESLERLAFGRTTIAIAHRLSTLRNADRLYVIEDGRIVESGSHDELLAARGVFHRLVRKQQRALRVIGVGG